MYRIRNSTQNTQTRGFILLRKFKILLTILKLLKLYISYNYLLPRSSCRSEFVTDSNYLLHSCD